MQYSILVVLVFALSASALPSPISRADFTLQNGKDAIALNQKFATLDDNSPCQTGDDACIGNQFSQCVSGKFVKQACAGDLICAALPLVNSPGTSIACTTAADRDARIAATGANANDNGDGSADSDNGNNEENQNGQDQNRGDQNRNDNDDPQTSLTLLQSVIATGFANDGQSQPAAGQVASLTSTNNFINFCATVPNMKITNGQQIREGSCNTAPMGVLPAAENMPSSKFVFPKNGGTVPANEPFTIKMAVRRLDTGHFTNPDENYFAAPQQLNERGRIKGHSHVVIEALPSFDSTEPLDPNGFVFFKGLNDKAVDGVLSTDVGDGLPAGVYRMSSINSAANHQPVLAPIAQHGSLDDVVYFTVE